MSGESEPEVRGILDYAAEAKDGELPETVKPIDEEEPRGFPLGTWVKSHGTSWDHRGE